MSGLPVGSFRLMTPNGAGESGVVSNLSTFAGKPTVVHLYTG